MMTIPNLVKRLKAAGWEMIDDTTWSYKNYEIEIIDDYILCTKLTDCRLDETTIPLASMSASAIITRTILDSFNVGSN